MYARIYGLGALSCEGKLGTRAVPLDGWHWFNVVTLLTLSAWRSGSAQEMEAGGKSIEMERMERSMDADDGRLEKKGPREGARSAHQDSTGKRTRNFTYWKNNTSRFPNHGVS